jgi:glucose-fructose oxidoreductase
VVGRRGTISSYDYEKTVRLQTPDRPEGRDLPVDTLAAPCRNPLEYLVDCLDRGVDVEGPLSPAMARIGQRMVDAAVRSAREERTVPLPD